MNTNHTYYSKFLLLLKFLIVGALIYFPLFGHLNTYPIRIWDESRLAINAYEMYEDGDLIVTHFDGKPDLWNTKPPLMIWSQVFFMKLIGVNELSVRLPSAFGALFTCLFFLYFSNIYFKQFWPGLIVSMVLCTTHGYIYYHGARSGDYDVMLTLFTTIYALSFLIYLEKKDLKFLYLTFFSIALATLTKSVTGLLFLPALFIYSLIQGGLIPLLKNKHLYIGILMVIAIVAGFYSLREFQEPGYLEAVKNNELWGRFNNSLDGHKGNFWFYINKIIDREYSYWYMLFPIGLAIGLFNRNKKIFRLILYSLLILCTFFLIISSAETKLRWYDIPMYPFISIVISVFIITIFNFLSDLNFIKRNGGLKIIPFLFLLAIFTYPYKRILDVTFTPTEVPWDQDFYRTSYFLKDAVAKKKDLNNYFIVYEGTDTHLLFYVKLLQEQGNLIAIKKKESILIGDHIITQQQHIVDYITNNYNCEVLSQDKNLKIFKIHGRENPD
ncbi:MAG: glycosyltransferase family 39 protein [Bacteroidales bacterium]|nr:glycosyltransferase family 39 protein [Bacteroidales bacterium]